MTPTTELVEKLHKTTQRDMSHTPARRHWLTATQLIACSAQRLASEEKFRNGQWILIGRWREHEAGLARALQDLAMVRLIAIGIRSTLHEDADSHFFDLQHIERTIRAIDELQRHPRFSRLSSQPHSTEIQPA